MPYQQGSSADHFFEKEGLEYFGLFLFFVGACWLLFSAVESLRVFPALSYRISERFASIVVYTVIYIIAMSIAVSYRKKTQSG